MKFIWLPLDGKIQNKGTILTSITNNGAAVQNTGGKISPKCYYFNGSSNYMRGTYNATSEISFCCWVYFPTIPTGKHLFDARSADEVGYQPMYITANSIQIGAGGSSSSFVSISYSWQANKWYHICVTHDSTSGKLYINGELQATTAACGVNFGTCNFTIGSRFNQSNYCEVKINDIRIYNHCLSAAEVKKIAKGLVLHYKLDNYSKETTENLFKGTMFRPEDMSNWPGNSSTDWTKPVRRYNGSTSIYNIDSGECTVTLNAAANLGICFARLASDINLRSWVKYTISCEAKCSKSGASLAIGLSYYNTSNGWVWRGRTNAVAFKATNTWQTFTLSFYPDSDTQAIDYCFTVVGDANGTNTFTIRHCRMEEGSIATPWYPEDDIYTQMTKVIDSSGYNNNAESNGHRIVNLGAGGIRYSKVAQFTTGARITTPMTSNTFLPTDAITVNIWCKTSDVSQRFLSCTEGGGWNFEVSGGALTFPIYIEGVGYQICSFTTPLSTMNDNQWHMYTATYDRSQIKVYFDGILDNTLNVSTGNSIQYQTYTPLCLGTEAQSIGNQVAGTFIGTLSDLRIYCTPLSDEDIKELYYMGMKIDKGQNIYTYEFKEISNSDIKLYKTGVLQNIEFNETTTAAFKKTKKITASQFIEE